MVCQQGNWVNDEQIDCQEFLDFVFGEGTCPKLLLEPGVYKAEEENKSRKYLQYALVKPSGHIYVFSLEEYDDSTLSFGTSIQDLWPDISLYQPQSTLTVVNIKGSEIVKILPEEEFRRLTQPRPFSICLVGDYGGDHYGGPDESGTCDESGPRIWIDHFHDHAKVLPDGSVHWTPRYAIDGDKVDARGGPEPSVLQVKSVSRPDKWTVKLHPGQVPRLEVVYPPLCVLEMTNGKILDLSDCGFGRTSALLSSTRISYHGSIKETESSDCIVSFPGRYADGWRECVQASSHDMGVACVFLCGKDDGFGQHAIDPDGDGKACYCHKIYGRRKFDVFGYKSEEECEANGSLPKWGCLWFEKWRSNVETAVKRKQRLIAYFFEGQVGEGLVAWDVLAKADLWNGSGIGGSQKGEVAFLEKTGYKFDMRDVDEFLNSFAKDSAIIP